MSGKNRLAIDDEADICRVVKGRPGRSGRCGVTIAPCGKDGVENFSSGESGLVITGFGMPGMDGKAILESVKARRAAGDEEGSRGPSTFSELRAAFFFEKRGAFG